MELISKIIGSRRAFFSLTEEGGKGINMASIRERKGKFNVIYNYKDDSGHSQVDMVTDVYSHIIDEERRRNAELFEEAFYEKKNLDPKMHDETTSQTVDVPDDVDAELLAKVLANPEMKATLASLVKAMK